MNMTNEKKLFHQFVTENELARKKRTRNNPFDSKSIRKGRKSELDEALEDGWEIRSETKTTFKLTRTKKPDVQWEDEVWVTMADLGFIYLNKDRHCNITYNQAGHKTQVDVLAVDNETAIVIECKASDSATPRPRNLKTIVEAIQGQKEGLIRTIRNAFGEELKVGFILATKNYEVSTKDQDRMKALDIKHFDSDAIAYYKELSKHLGQAARYQFEADLFPNTRISSMDNRVPAIRGKMGGHTYYSFSIEPEKLLKISYVLHRSKSMKILPSYQRMIKKSRLKKVQTFVDEGGYFPNSIVINIDSTRAEPKFESLTQKKGKIPVAGILHLPNVYRSAYIIDGQHRLYGYSNSHYSESNSIPVVAFVGLDGSEQLKLFMEINENQKSVPRNLRITLDADLKWNSKDLDVRIDGLQKQIAQDFGEDNSSPLKGRVKVGEDETTDVRVITLQAILTGLKRTDFFGKFKKNRIEKSGTFYAGSNDETIKIIRPFLFQAFEHLKHKLPDEWNRKQEDSGLLTVNTGVTAVIWILNDILNHLIKQDSLNPLKANTEDIIVASCPYLLGVVDFFNDLSDDERQDIRSNYGSGAPTRLWRHLQKAIHNVKPSFSPTGLDKYWQDQSKQFNESTRQRLEQIELILDEEIRKTLESKHGSNWLKVGIPAPLYKKLHQDATEENIKILDDSPEREPWDCMYLINYSDVISHGSNFSKLFQKRFSMPRWANSSKERRLKWIKDLNDIRNKVSHPKRNRSVTKQEADFVEAIYNWLELGDEDPIIKLNSS